MTTISTQSRAMSSVAIPEDLRPAISRARPTGHSPVAPSCLDQDADETHYRVVGAGYLEQSNVGWQLNGSQGPVAPQRSDAAVELQFCAAYLDDVERLRIATENRIRAFEQAGFSAEPYGSQVDTLRAIEHEATLALQRAVRKHPLGPWIARTVGVGEKQGARLIAALGSVSYNHAEDRPRRGPAELWAYCGFKPGQRRQKGVRSNWNAQAKMRAFLIAESCIKQRHSPYRADYDQARQNWIGRDVSEGHAHNHALRVVAKSVLKDLFLEARELGA